MSFEYCYVQQAAHLQCFVAAKLHGIDSWSILGNILRATKLMWLHATDISHDTICDVLLLCCYSNKVAQCIPALSQCVRIYLCLFYVKINFLLVLNTKWHLQVHVWHTLMSSLCSDSACSHIVSHVAAHVVGHCHTCTHTASCKTLTHWCPSLTSSLPGRPMEGWLTSWRRKALFPEMSLKHSSLNSEEKSKPSRARLSKP